MKLSIITFNVDGKMPVWSDITFKFQSVLSQCDELHLPRVYL